MINILSQMKKFLVELMNQIPYLITQSINHFYFSSFFPQKVLLISFFVHYSVIQLRYFQRNYFLDNFSLLDGLLRLFCLLMVHSRFIMIIEWTECSYIATFSNDTCSWTTVFLASHWATINNQLLLLNIFSFSSGIFTYQLNSFLLWFLNLLLSTSY